MDNQEAFTRIVTHLRKQGEKSIDSCGACRYRDPVTKRRCAIGVLITDEFYSEAIEGRTCLDLQALGLLKAALPRVSFGLLNSCQGGHDIYPCSQWEQKWREVATYYGLIVPILEEPPLEEKEELVCAI